MPIKPPNFCASCGSPVSGEGRFCRECGAALGSGGEISPTENKSEDSRLSDNSGEQASEGKPKKSNPVGLFIAWTGVAVLASPVLFFAFWMLSSALGGAEEEEEARPATSQAAPPAQERPSDLSAMECLTVEGNVMAVEYNFRQGEATPSHVVLVLETTAIDFEEIASSHSGSERDWLLKMSELSVSLADFIESGTGDGELVFDQLMNNYGLVEQFCG